MSILCKSVTGPMIRIVRAESHALPGAAGRDNSSVACATCLEGLHARGGECVPCGTGEALHTEP